MDYAVQLCYKIMIVAFRETGRQDKSISTLKIMLTGDWMRYLNERTLV